MISILLLIAAVHHNVQAVCNVCQTNGAACINSTSFYMCFGGTTPNGDRLYHCKKGFDCTDLNAICTQSSASRPASCGDTALCGSCRAHRDYLFACTSRTTFRYCYGATQPQGDEGVCPDGYVCDASVDNVCVPAITANAITCDVLKPTDDANSSASSTTERNEITPLTPLTPQDVCDEKLRVGVYQIPGDVMCVQYIKCAIRNRSIYGTIANCPAGTFFNGRLLQCTFEKPVNCL